MRWAASLVIAGLALAACSGGREAQLGDPRYGQVGVPDPGNGSGSGTTYIVDPFAAPIASVPRALCGPGSAEETGLQGEVPQADRDSGRSLLGYSCNLELVGQFKQGEGANYGFASFNDCGYYATVDREERETPKGTIVVDASDSLNPVSTAALQTPGMNDPHESLSINEQRGLLAAAKLTNGNGGFYPDPGPGDWGTFDVYDVSNDCAHPELKASIQFPDTNSHGGNWAFDGLTYYTGSGDAFDVHDPANPKWLGLAASSHDPTTSFDGTRGYMMNTPNGLSIINLSEFQNRVPDPQIVTMSTLAWPGLFGQMAQYVTYNGKPFVIGVEEGLGAAIIDVSDDANPVIVSTIRLEVHLVQNGLPGVQNIAVLVAFGAAGVEQPDLPEAVPNPHNGLYWSHYCRPDRWTDPTALACGFTDSGIRVFDIRDPYQPREIAYFNPPVNEGPKPGVTLALTTADLCWASAFFKRDRGELWTSCNRSEFIALKFTNGVWPFPE